MNVIEVVKQMLTDYPKITEFTNDIHVDFTDSEPTNFGLSSTGDQLLSEDILGNQIRQHNFVLYAVNQSISDYDRLANSTFLLDLSYWLETVKGQEIETTVNEQIKTGKIVKMSSANAMLYEIPNGDINGGVTYQVQIYAQYTLESEE
ncbi:hypothetical protein [Anaerosacchariphilus polymeriproducens]|uniref:Minor capsid protein n=1 Tax=Anaerosacchariphilus polymeriproducens TaxID=1812858 RepID=A0A371AQU1_9FIRM|nr:hypothetical protein [Anaerosacchariphilus polymeriproducens]RDU21938.1 hypothetical protein DWV06_15485 [Anaerosacchariphilus polymeriproducens]